MSKPTFVLVDNYYDVINRMEDVPERTLLVLSRITGGTVFDHDGAKYIRVDVESEDEIIVKLESFMASTIADDALTWISVD